MSNCASMLKCEESANRAFLCTLQDGMQKDFIAVVQQMCRRERKLRNGRESRVVNILYVADHTHTFFKVLFWGHDQPKYTLCNQFELRNTAVQVGDIVLFSKYVILLKKRILLTLRKQLSPSKLLWFDGSSLLQHKLSHRSSGTQWSALWISRY